MWVRTPGTLQGSGVGYGPSSVLPRHPLVPSTPCGPVGYGRETVGRDVRTLRTPVSGVVLGFPTSDLEPVVELRSVVETRVGSWVGTQTGVGVSVPVGRDDGPRVELSCLWGSRDVLTG